MIDIDRLNSDCACITLDQRALWQGLDACVGEPGFGRALAETHPTLLSHQPLFLRSEDRAAMASAIAAIESVIRSRNFEAEVLASAPEIARHPSPLNGVFMGYDFHLGADGPKLIEINTNAGGALINAALYHAQSACCAAVTPVVAAGAEHHGYEADFIAAFREEWRRARGKAPLRSIAIVDVAPRTQYLFPEFLLFQRLFERAGLAAVIAGPEELVRRDGGLWHRERSVDLVYNRLTDFSFETPGCAELRAAYLADEAVITPNPRIHALYANKRNLILLSDADALRRMGVAEDVIATVTRAIPRVVAVTAENADALWVRRDRLFFKPATGYGSRGAYRGDKLTRRVWETIVAGDFIAQDLVPPSVRHVTVDGVRQALKVDVRNYSYEGRVQLVAARLYSGQTTNMRTPGGGFSPVLSVPSGVETSCARG